MWNGFDLRPATAFQAPSFTKSTIEDSHEIGDTKEVDLGSLAAQLFSASPEKEQMSRKANEVSAASEPRLKRPESANLWTRSSRRPMSCHSDDGSQQNIRSSRASSQGTGKSGDTGRQEMTLQSSTTQGPLVSSRKAHSARPAKRVEPNLDPSAWQPALDAKRPPSRQKPPPEALHLFSPQSFVNVHNGAAQRRPKTTMAITRRPTRPPSGPSVHESPSSTRPTAPRPPSRQKPPPESLGLGQAKGRPSKTYRQIFVSDSDDETLGHLSPQTHQSSTPEISDG
ncbi:hypothetical protein BSKO_11202 [Bryopsis sp. KO-2023]|nr:hypothetical protein BSKO_11202 [Bryopsis sp. KO-2023]